jgi:hypothetical protein
VTIAAHAEDPSTLAWLEEFLTPAFDGSDAARAECCVLLDTDPARYREIVRLGPRPDGGRIAGFVLDDRVATHAAWRSAGDERSVFDDRLGAFYVVSRSGARVQAVTDGLRPASRVALMRVVRELTLSRLRLQGGLLLHGAALASAARGIIIAGPKEAGKTTLAMHALRAPGARFVSNDRVWLDLLGEPMRMRGVPSIVAIRPSTLDCFPAVRERLRHSGYRHALTIGEARAAKRPPTEKPASVTAAQLCDALGVRAEAEAPLSSIVFPRVSGGAGGIEIEPLTATAAARRLAASLFHAANPAQVSEAFPPPEGARVPDAFTLHERCATVAARVPCYDARLGRDAYGDPSSAEALVRELAAEATEPPRT